MTKDADRTWTDAQRLSWWFGLWRNALLVFGAMAGGVWAMVGWAQNLVHKDELRSLREESHKELVRFESQLEEFEEHAHEQERIIRTTQRNIEKLMWSQGVRPVKEAKDE